jgi:hypothetical protein
MWHFNRFNRPPWATGLCITIAVVVTAIGATISYFESRRIKRIEGVSPPIDRMTLQQAVRNIPGQGADTCAQRNRARAVVWEQASVIQVLEDSGMVFDVVFEILELLLGLTTGTGAAFEALQEARSALSKSSSDPSPGKL